MNNIQQIYLILDAQLEKENFDKSTDFSDLQLQNKLLILLIKVVVVLPKFIDIKLVHSENIYDISVTFEKSNFDKSIDCKLEQPLNMLLIIFNDNVFISPKLGVISFEHS